MPSNGNFSILCLASSLRDVDLSHACLRMAMEDARDLEAASAVCLAAIFCCFARDVASEWAFMKSVLIDSGADSRRGSIFTQRCHW